ncbi:MAG: amino acid permease, partial [Gammaproteobacteria bacterium]|nr:amino acid permease [Gammaproteobacteria bacterium]
MTIATQPGNGPGLRRALGTFDLVLLNIAAIVGLRWLSTAAQLGPASLTLWIIAFLLFFVPSALTVQELSSRIPHVGGLYRWTQAAFGDTHGFLAGWAYWVSNLVYFPSVLLFVSGVILHVAGPSLRPLAENPLYNGLFCLALLWGVTFLNILGLRRAKWLQNIGGLASLAIGAQVLIGGAVAWWRFGSATHVSLASLAPDLNSLPTLNTFAILILAFVGLELGPILGDEIRNSARSIRRAIMISGVAITVIYVAGTASLLVALPPGQIGVISGIPEAMEATGQRIGMPSFGMVAAALLAITSAGGLGAWITGTARLPFVMGLGHYLPGKLGAIHPRHGTPHVALLVQAAATSVVLLGAISGSTVHEAYLLLIDMTAALSCAVWVYTFAALPVLRRRGIGERADVALIPGGTRVGWLVAWIGVLATTFATVVSLIPPEGSAHPM